MTKGTSEKVQGTHRETSQTPAAVGIEVETKKKGELFLEGRAKGRHCENKNELQINLGRALSYLTGPVDFGANILTDTRVTQNALLSRLLANSDGSHILCSLKIVECRGLPSDASRFLMSEWNLRVNLYELYNDEITSTDDDVVNAEVTSMPNGKFEGIWQRLSFQNDWKATMTSLATNMLLPSQSRAPRQRCPVIVFYGPAGTGKTTFAQGLAQKLSIRLSNCYKITKFYEVRSAVLHSRFHGQSAKEVDEIFGKIRQASEEDEKALIIVLVDEVESIAGSRETIVDHGESQDALRATNALLTTLDKLKLRPNVLVLCTTNHYSHLDAAFLDRCVAKREIKPPRKESQYEILRSGILDLIENGDILCETTSFPDFAEAKRMYRARESDSPACTLYHLLETVRTAHKKKGNSLSGPSGRYLAGLPGSALDMFREQGCCLSLHTAFEFFERYVSLETGKPEEMDSDSEEEIEGGFEEEDVHMSDRLPHQSRRASEKRKFNMMLNEEEMYQVLAGRRLS